MAATKTLVQQAPSMRLRPQLPGPSDDLVVAGETAPDALSPSYCVTLAKQGAECLDSTNEQARHAAAPAAPVEQKPKRKRGRPPYSAEKKAEIAAQKQVEKDEGKRLRAAAKQDKFLKKATGVPLIIKLRKFSGVIKIQKARGGRISKIRTNSIGGRKDLARKGRRIENGGVNHNRPTIISIPKATTPCTEGPPRGDLTVDPRLRTNRTSAIRYILSRSYSGLPPTSLPTPPSSPERYVSSAPLKCSEPAPMVEFDAEHTMPNQIDDAYEEPELRGSHPVFEIPADEDYPTSFRPEVSYGAEFMQHPPLRSLGPSRHEVLTARHNELIDGIMNRSITMSTPVMDMYDEAITHAALFHPVALTGMDFDVDIDVDPRPNPSFDAEMADREMYDTIMPNAETDEEMLRGVFGLERFV